MRTYSTLRVISPHATPEKISELLGLEATKVSARDPIEKYKHQREQNGWFLSTEDRIESTKSEDHLAYIVQLLDGKEPILAELRKMGCYTDVFNFWEGSGQGGPVLSPDLMNSMSQLGLTVMWDNYFDEDEST